MRKLLLFTFVAMITGISYAQEGSSKSLTFYLEGDSGYLTQNPSWETGLAGRVFSGNNGKFGLVYDQKFSNGVGYWFKTEVTNYISVGFTQLSTSADPDNDGGYLVSTNNQAYATTRSGMYYTVNAQVGINYEIGGFSTSLAIARTTLFENEIDYTLSFGNAGSLTFGQDTYFYAMPSSYTVISTNYQDGDASELDDDGNAVNGYTVSTNKNSRPIGMLNLYQLRVAYDIDFNDKLNYKTQVGVRFNNDHNATMFGQSLVIRWDNQINYQILDGLAMYGRVRYDVSGLGAKGRNSDNEWVSNKNAIDHQVRIQAGISYALDFSSTPASSNNYKKSYL